MTRTVKHFNKTLGRGIVRGDQDSVYFVHGSEIGGTLDRGERLEFWPTATPKGLRALEVRSLAAVAPRRGPR